MTEKAEEKKATTPEKNPLEKTVKFTVSGAELKAGIDAEIKRHAKHAKIAGFRPGHVPMDTVRAMYGHQAYVDVLNDLIAREFEKAAKKAKLMMVGMPSIKPVEGKEDDENLKFTGTVECYPEFDIPAFDKLELKKYSCAITDVEVKKTIDVMVKQRVKYVEDKARKAASGDRVTLDFTGTKDGVAFQGGTAKDFAFVIDEGRMLPDFEKAVTGMAAGENKTFKMTFPKDYFSKDLQGQEVEFALNVKKVELAQYPEVDDKFAKSIGLNSVQEMTEEVKKNLERETQMRIHDRTKNEAMTAIEKLCTFKAPTAMVEEEKKALAEQAKQRALSYGLDAKAAAKLPLEMFAQEAEKRVRLGILVNKLVTEEKLAATMDDVKKLIATMSAAYEKPEEMEQWYLKDKERAAGLLNVATENKVLDFVMGKAKVTEEKLDFDKVMSTMG